jgi:DNA-binding protein H-NS
MELKSLSLVELKKLKARLDKEIAKRALSEKKKVLKEFKALTKAHGIDITEIIKVDGRNGRRKSHGVARKRSVKRAVSVKYQHPENPKLTWTGRGKKPKWLHEWLAAGGSLESLVINQAAATPADQPSASAGAAAV